MGEPQSNESMMIEPHGGLRNGDDVEGLDPSSGSWGWITRLMIY